MWQGLRVKGTLGHTQQVGKFGVCSACAVHSSICGAAVFRFLRTLVSNPSCVCDFSSFLNAQVHLGLKPYKCNTCGTSFGQPGSLIRHISAVHHKRKDHACDHPGCGKSFSERWTLQVHRVSSLSLSSILLSPVGTSLVQSQYLVFNIHFSLCARYVLCRKTFTRNCGRLNAALQAVTRSLEIFGTSGSMSTMCIGSNTEPGVRIHLSRFGQGMNLARPVAVAHTESASSNAAVVLPPARARALGPKRVVLVTRKAALTGVITIAAALDLDLPARQVEPVGRILGAVLGARLQVLVPQFREVLMGVINHAAAMSKLIQLRPK